MLYQAHLVCAGFKLITLLVISTVEQVVGFSNDHNHGNPLIFRAIENNIIDYNEIFHGK
jgi:hypothetical protein